MISNSSGATFLGPRIEPVAPGEERPFWSVMIPAYNSSPYLARAIESVLAQDLGAARMQIEVVDNCSTKDDPAALVRHIGRGRVQFTKNSRNLGMVGNFNKCIQRSRGHLVHILHGDDFVLDEYYEEVEKCAVRFPDAALIASRVFFCDEHDVIDFVSGRVLTHENKPSTNLTQFWLHNPLQCAGVAVRRSFYETYGGFRQELTYAPDWEMWIRAVSRGSGIVLPHVLAAYRAFNGNQTQLLKRTAANLVDLERFSALISSSYGAYPVAQARNTLIEMAKQQEGRFAATGDHEAALANRRFWQQRTEKREWSKSAIESILRRISRAMHGR